jgi:hypothetical protein
LQGVDINAAGEKMAGITVLTTVVNYQIRPDTGWRPN